jgi:hypothetical protein
MHYSHLRQTGNSGFRREQIRIASQHPFSVRLLAQNGQREQKSFPEQKWGKSPAVQSSSKG